MKDHAELLYKLCNLFKKKYSDFSYTNENIQLWSLTKYEYIDVYLHAADVLKLENRFSLSQLQETSERFCAELLKTCYSSIILINEDLIKLGIETNRIILHELAHAFCYKANIDSSLYNPYNSHKNFSYEFYGWQMWNEYLAEFLAQSILQVSDNRSGELLFKEFQSLMHDVAYFPQHMGFFLAKYRSLKINNSDFFRNHLHVLDTKEYGIDLIKTFQKIDQLLNEKVNCPKFWIEDESFLGELGQLLLLFAFFYLSYYKQTYNFLKEI